MKKIKSWLKRISIKKFMLSIPIYISSLQISKIIILSFEKLDVQSKLESWGISQYLYILFFIPISILTLMSLILLIEGQMFHLFADTRCEINAFLTQDQYCKSYFGLMLGIVIISVVQIFIYWHYITSLKHRLFSSTK